MRIEGRAKVTGNAKYAYEYPAENVAYAFAVTSDVARGEVLSVRAPELPGLIAVLSCMDPPDIAPVPDAELHLFQSRTVSYRGQIIAAVVAETLETAREAGRLLEIEYAPDDMDVELDPDHPGLYQPEKVNGGFAPESGSGEPADAFAESPVRVDVTYATPAEYNNAMEPHATLAEWTAPDRLVVHDSNQGSVVVRDTLAKIFGLDPEQVRVVSPHVGGGFGSKGTPRPVPVLAALAARAAGRPVKLAVTRQQMFATVGYRTPTVQRVRLGADPDGRLRAVLHESVAQTSRIREFAEQAAVAARHMYRTPNLYTGHRVVRLDVPSPSWMRAPGETPGMYALESAMDELACAAGIDPIELRVRNEPETDPDTGLPFSSRNLVACLREGADRFGWAHRDPRPGVRREGRTLVGTGVAAATYPAMTMPAKARVRAEEDGTFTVSIAAADIGTGARTVLTGVAAETLKAEPDAVTVRIGESDLPRAPLAGGSMGTASWGHAVVRACEALLAKLGDGLPQEAEADTADELKNRPQYARHAFGAHFAETAVDLDTGEIRVRRLLGVYAAGRILNPQTARSQFLGGMTMGAGMALMERGVLDLEFGDYLNHDLAQYHVPVCADVPDIDAAWIEEADPHLNAMGAKGIGEIGIVGVAAAIGNAVHHATGVRFRELPLTPPAVLPALAAHGVTA
ncbi:Xanthine dehydrogenase molybdenum-binding subunit [Actinomadura rubteroloni]|uniref:Xanthine dehydrogenase molybdenum-binding subunit n=1 Tax=Actinomadura rubteroloni TaxID=1926885 RepID=A0A2P4URG2_9ACTN|nr:xanthine dehydrogenase family protein molybdopterin-binding subunit [Actinomadura rubteroloni]POM27604.1 Xanthine dehydrogenase molybdenum-binding subunit [Actinomadura rubteroloni]